MSQQINLFNPIFLKQKKLFSARTMLQALGVIALGLMGVTTFAFWQVNALKAEVERSEKRLQAEELRLAQAKKALTARRSSDQLADEIKRLEGELERRQTLAALLEKGALGETVGLASFLRAMARQHQEGLWLTAVELTGRDLALVGRALRPEAVPDYLRRLGREEVLRGREFASLVITRPKGDDQTDPPYVEFVLRTTPPKEQP
ncbi:PilN domain-containing protein [Thiobacter aerophilum]|uniref:PilN domain-containing protein n=1 Tax=Thiobacter aerophilum TaxID=3121275 RepID=A0ABV0EIR7_9BURK